jgi:hypothetical protein
MGYGAAVYINETPEVAIDAAGNVHLTYASGGRFYERIVPIAIFEAYLEEAQAQVMLWRATAIAAEARPACRVRATGQPLQG